MYIVYVTYPYIICMYFTAFDAHAGSKRRQHTPAAHAGSTRRQHTPAAHAGSTRRQYTPAAHAGSTRRQHTPAANVAIYILYVYIVCTKPLYDFLEQFS